MIAVSNNHYPVDFPVWVKACPLCNQNESDKHILVESDNMNVHFSLCKSCRMELARKLRT